jgi:hypothetical protein
MYRGEKSSEARLAPKVFAQARGEASRRLLAIEGGSAHGGELHSVGARAHLKLSHTLTHLRSYAEALR